MFCVSSPAEAAQQKPPRACQPFGYLSIFTTATNRNHGACCSPLGISPGFSCCFQLDQPKALILFSEMRSQRNRMAQARFMKCFVLRLSHFGAAQSQKTNKNIAIKITAFPTLTQIPAQEKGGRRGTDTQGGISSSAQTHLLGEPVTHVGLGAGGLWQAWSPRCPQHSSSVSSDISANHMALSKNIIVFIFQFSVFCVECCCVQAKWIKA